MEFLSAGRVACQLLLLKLRSALTKIAMQTMPVHSGNDASISMPLRSTIMPATGGPAASPNHHAASTATACKPSAEFGQIGPMI